MELYRKKPVVIEAVRFTGVNQGLIAEWVGAPLPGMTGPDAAIEIHTLEGTMTARKGDWVIKGVKGEFYPCKDEVFRATYELVEG